MAEGEVAVCVGEGFGAERGFWLHLGVWAGRGHIPKVPEVGPVRVHHHSKPRGADSRGYSPTWLGLPLGCEPGGYQAAPACLL